MRIAVADDEKLFRERIGNFLEKFFSLKEIGYEVEYFESGKKIIELGENIKFFDIFFLDVSMQDVDGIEAAKAIRRYSEDVFIVFVTAYIDYSIEGYKVNAIRYVLKDQFNLESSMTECLDAILKKMAFRKPVKRFHFNEGEKDVSIEKILYIESLLHKIEFHILDDEQEVLTMYQTLNSLERELAGFGTFVRIHQSFLVNLRYIRTINHYTVFLSNNEEIKVPKARYGDVKKAFIKYKREV